MPILLQKTELRRLEERATAGEPVAAPAAPATDHATRVRAAHT